MQNKQIFRVKELYSTDNISPFWYDVHHFAEWTIAIFMHHLEVYFVIVEWTVAVFALYYQHALELFWDYFATELWTFAKLDSAFEVFFLLLVTWSLDLD